LTHFGTYLLDPKAHLTNRWAFSIQFFINEMMEVYYENTITQKKLCNLVHWVIWCGHLAVKIGFTPRPIRHSHRDGHLSNSGAVESS